MAKIAPPSHPGLPSDLEVQLYVPDGQEGYRADAKATVLEAMLHRTQPQPPLTPRASEAALRTAKAACEKL